jgi:hypothetical protein
VATRLRHWRMQLKRSKMVVNWKLCLTWCLYNSFVIVIKI